MSPLESLAKSINKYFFGMSHVLGAMGNIPESEKQLSIDEDIMTDTM